MSGRSLILILAVVSGLGAMYGARQVLQRSDAPVQLVDVVVAARDLRVDEVLKDDMLKLVKRPAGQTPDSFSELSELVGRLVRISMLADEPILDAKLAEKGTPPGLIGRIPIGMRALAVEVNEQTGVSGFILPDHHVDIVQPVEPTDPGGRAAITVLRDVLVLAAGQATARSEDRTIQVRTVTVAVTPREVEILVAARSRGPLSLALRGFGATDPPEEELVAFEEPTPPALPEPEPAPEPPVVAPPPPPVFVEAPRPPRHTLIYRGFAPPERRPMVGGPRGPESGTRSVASRIAR